MAFKNVILSYAGKKKTGTSFQHIFFDSKGKIFFFKSVKEKFIKGTVYQFRASIIKQKSGAFKLANRTVIGMINNRGSLSDRKKEKARMLAAASAAGVTFTTFSSAVVRKMEAKILSVAASSPYMQISLGNNIIDKCADVMKLNFQSTFDDYIRATQFSLGFNYDLPFKAPEVAALAARKSPIINDMTIRSVRLKNELKQKLLQNIGEGMPAYKIVKALKESYPSFSRHIGTLVNTGLQRLYKDGSYSKTRQHFKKFIYSGPRDSVNRAYCAAHIGKEYEGTAADEQQAVIMDFYNCRHQMEPVID